MKKDSWFRSALLSVLLAVPVAVVGCDDNHCSLGVEGAKRCSGYTSGDDFYVLEYDAGWFYGALWCGGRPQPGRQPDFTCGGNRGAQGQGNDLVCISYGPVPGALGQEIPQDRVSCS